MKVQYLIHYLPGKSLSYKVAAYLEVPYYPFSSTDTILIDFTSS